MKTAINNRPSFDIGIGIGHGVFYVEFVLIGVVYNYINGVFKIEIGIPFVKSIALIFEKQ